VQHFCDTCFSSAAKKDDIIFDKCESAKENKEAIIADFISILEEKGTNTL
jgi:hypothetical protein